MANSFVDRRLNPKGKSHANRQRFMRVAKSELKEAVARSLKDKGITDLAKEGGTVSISTRRIAEPKFRLSSQGGNRDYVLPGNKEYGEGDSIPRPPSGGGQGGRNASPDGEAEDVFQFTLSRDEYLDILFEDMELPDLVKTDLKKSLRFDQRRAGYVPSGSPSNLALVRTMRNSLARRLALSRPKSRDLEEIEAEIAALEKQGGDPERLERLLKKRDGLRRRLQAMPFLDPIDLRYKRYEPTPRPNVSAVMFCLMDVSGSMTEHMKGLAKRFFLLLHLFLTRRYESVDLVFIRHTSEAKEVDEETFFSSRETGGTVVSTALEKMIEIIEERYPLGSWNIYAAQASDGDNHTTDTALCLALLEERILPISQYFAYIEVREDDEDPISVGGDGASGLWRGYEELVGRHASFAMRRVGDQGQIFPVFHDLFAKKVS